MKAYAYSLVFFFFSSGLPLFSLQSNYNDDLHGIQWDDLLIEIRRKGKRHFLRCLSIKLKFASCKCEVLVYFRLRFFFIFFSYYSIATSLIFPPQFKNVYSTNLPYHHKSSLWLVFMEAIPNSRKTFHAIGRDVESEQKQAHKQSKIIAASLFSSHYVPKSKWIKYKQIYYISWSLCVSVHWRPLSVLLLLF